MSRSLYLDMLDETLRTGIRGLSAAFVAAQVQFVAGCQQPDGGFCGRQGGADLYYTDFALRCLALLAPDHPAFDRAGRYGQQQVDRPHSVVACFSFLNIQRLLASRGAENNRATLLARLCEHLLPCGGMTRSAEPRAISAYQTFLGALCFEMLDEPLPSVDGAVQAIAALGQPDGGYAEATGQSLSQTNATAAAVGFLTLQDALPPERAALAVRFLGNMQSADGGLRPHADVSSSDLLSTFTGLLTLAALDGLDAIDALGIARFLRNAAQSDGGFLACPGDDTPDVEYTYYGIGVLAILNAIRR